MAWNRRATVIAVIVVVVGIQFVPVDHSNPPTEQEVPAPAPVRDVLKRACYNCHSNETKWPWYSYVAPVSWLVAHDVEEARHHMNFSAWNRLSPVEQAEHQRGVWKKVENGDMPPQIYRSAHEESHLSQADLEALRTWAESAPKVEVEPGHEDEHNE